MRKAFTWALGILILAGAGALLVWAFVQGRRELALEREREQPVTAPSRLARAPGGGVVITLDRATQTRIALAAEPLVATALQPEVIAYGTLQEDPSRSFTLRAPVAGLLRRSEASAWPEIGQALADGAVVGVIESRFAPVDRVGLASQRAAAQADVAAVTASLAVARASFERAKVLNAEGKTVSDRALEEAEARVKGEEAQLEAATERVRLLDAALAGATGSTGPLPLTVQRGGQVVEVVAQPGEAVESGQPIVRVTRFDQMLARVAVPAGDRVGGRVSAARVIVIGHEDRPLRGQRIAMGAAADPKTLGQVFLFRVTADGVALRPGEAVTVYLAAPGDRRTGVVIPRAAVVRAEGNAWVYVQIGEEQFSRREVALDHPTAGGWFTASGFTAGDRVVVAGAQLLLSEEFKSQIQIRE